MTIFISLWLLLTTLVGISVQECTTKIFQEERVYELLRQEIVEITNITSNFTRWNNITYNCLSTTDQNIGTDEYQTMSVSVHYQRAIVNGFGIERQIRYILICINNVWQVYRKPNNTVGTTREGCADCRNETDLHHCTR